MELNKENLKTLQKGDIIFSKDNVEYTFEALTGDIVVLMTEAYREYLCRCLFDI